MQHESEAVRIQAVVSLSIYHFSSFDLSSVLKFFSKNQDIKYTYTIVLIIMYSYEIYGSKYTL